MADPPGKVDRKGRPRFGPVRGVRLLFRLAAAVLLAWGLHDYFTAARAGWFVLTFHMLMVLIHPLTRRLAAATHSPKGCHLAWRTAGLVLTLGGITLILWRVLAAGRAMHLGWLLLLVPINLYCLDGLLLRWTRRRRRPAPGAPE